MGIQVPDYSPSSQPDQLVTASREVSFSVRGQIRAHSSGKATLTFYNVVAEKDRAENYTTHADASEEWTTFTDRAQRILHPAPSDNFSLGLFGVGAGDWFEVRELSLFVGTLP